MNLVWEQMSGGSFGNVVFGHDSFRSSGNVKNIDMWYKCLELERDIWTGDVLLGDISI